MRAHLCSTFVDICTKAPEAHYNSTLYSDNYVPSTRILLRLCRVGWADVGRPRGEGYLMGCVRREWFACVCDRFSVSYKSQFSVRDVHYAIYLLRYLSQVCSLCTSCWHTAHTVYTAIMKVALRQNKIHARVRWFWCCALQMRNMVLCRDAWKRRYDLWLPVLANQTALASFNLCSCFNVIIWNLTKILNGFCRGAFLEVTFFSSQTWIQSQCSQTLVRLLWIWSCCCHVAELRKHYRNSIARRQSEWRK